MRSHQALREMNLRLEELSRSDPLTGLANRRHFDEAKEIELRRAARSGLPLAVLLCDVDHFKRYNDTYGHAQGDACLRQVAAALRPACAAPATWWRASAARSSQCCCRPPTCAAALALADRLREAVAALRAAARRLRRWPRT